MHINIDVTPDTEVRVYETDYPKPGNYEIRLMTRDAVVEVNGLTASQLKTICAGIIYQLKLLVLVGDIDPHAEQTPEVVDPNDLGQDDPGLAT